MNIFDQFQACIEKGEPFTIVVRNHRSSQTTICKLSKSDVSYIFWLEANGAEYLLCETEPTHLRLEPYGTKGLAGFYASLQIPMVNILSVEP